MLSFSQQIYTVDKFLNSFGESKEVVPTHPNFFKKCIMIQDSTMGENAENICWDAGLRHGETKVIGRWKDDPANVTRWKQQRHDVGLTKMGTETDTNTEGPDDTSRE